MNRQMARALKLRCWIIVPLRRNQFLGVNPTEAPKWCKFSPAYPLDTVAESNLQNADNGNESREPVRPQRHRGQQMRQVHRRRDHRPPHSRVRQRPEEHIGAFRRKRPPCWPFGQLDPVELGPYPGGCPMIAFSRFVTCARAVPAGRNFRSRT